MEQLIYRNDIIEKLPFDAKFKVTLDCISNRDYPGRYHFNTSIMCLDTDTYEKSLQKPHSDRTVDAVIGVATYSNNRASNSCLMLVELRMNYKNTRNLSVTEIENKIAYTRNSIIGGNAPIKNESIFIFDKNVSEQARRWFSSQSRVHKSIKYCESCSVEEFSNIVKSQDDFPYIPINSEEKISDDLLCKKNDEDWNSFIRQIKYWHTEANKFKYNKNSSEYKHIMNVIFPIWNNFKQEQHSLTENQQLEIEIVDETFSTTTKK